MDVNRGWTTEELATIISARAGNSGRCLAIEKQLRENLKIRLDGKTYNFDEDLKLWIQETYDSSRKDRILNENLRN